MKILNQFFILSSSLLISINAHAISYEIIGPCSKDPVYSGHWSAIDLKKSAGEISQSIFDQQKIPYIGSSSGFSSILGTPTGDDAIEILSDTKMRAHGWCYSVNGKGPDVLAGDYFFNSIDDKLVWFFGYSTYDNGEWVDYCVPSYNVKADQFCSK
ncbi:MAG: DUF4430 domain-containing protein [Bacteriovorax sp.]